MFHRYLLQFVSWAALAGTVVPSCLFLVGRMDLETMKAVMITSTVVWFAVTPWWMQRTPDDAATTA